MLTTNIFNTTLKQNSIFLNNGTINLVFLNCESWLQSTKSTLTECLLFGECELTSISAYNLQPIKVF